MDETYTQTKHKKEALDDLWPACLEDTWQESKNSHQSFQTYGSNTFFNKFYKDLYPPWGTKPFSAL